MIGLALMPNLCTAIDCISMFNFEVLVQRCHNVCPGISNSSSANVWLAYHSSAYVDAKLVNGKSFHFAVCRLHSY
jgi:hypothetical protein